MFRILFIVTILVNSFIFLLGQQTESSPVETRCPEALERFTDAVLRTTSKALKAYADSSFETGAISPISSMFLLAAFAVYARNETKNEITSVIKLFTYEEIMCVTANLNNEAVNITGCAEFRAAPCIFANSRYPLTSDFMSTVETLTLEGIAENVDFSQSNININQQIAQQTGNRVPTTVPDYSIFNSSTQLVAVSALYLMAGWEIEFQSTNKVTQFRISPTKSEPQTFLYQDAEYYYAHSEALGARVVQVNMCLDQLALWILLPDRPFTENTLIDKMAENNDWYYELKKTLKPTRLDLYLPLYNKTTTVDSEYILREATGIKTTLDDQIIDLKGVIEGDIRAAVSTGVQTTIITNTLEGDPVPDGLRKGPKKTMIADYPFAFMVFRFGRAYFTGTVRRGGA